MTLEIESNKLDPCQECRFWKKLCETGWNQTICLLLNIFEPEENNMFPCIHFQSKEAKRTDFKDMELSGFECEKKQVILYFRKEAGCDTEIGFATLTIGQKFSISIEESEIR